MSALGADGAEFTTDLWVRCSSQVVQHLTEAWSPPVEIRISRSGAVTLEFELRTSEVIERCRMAERWNGELLSHIQTLESLLTRWTQLLDVQREDEPIASLLTASAAAVSFRRSDYIRSAPLGPKGVGDV